MTNEKEVSELRKEVDLKSMGFEEKMNKVSELIVQYPRFSEVLKKIEYCHRVSKFSSEPECLYVGGTTGAGKTTVSREYAKKYPQIEEGEITKVPVLMATIPSPATEKGMVTKILYAIGDPLAETGSKAVQTIRLMRLIKKCGVELIILDEFQHFIDRDSEKVLRTVTDWLKVLIEDTGVPLVLLGLNGGSNANHSEIIFDANPQLSRRFANRHTLQPFKFSSAKEIDEFRQFLSMIDMSLPLENRSGLADMDMATRFYYASDGVVAYIMKLIKSGTSMALQRNEEHLTADILTKAFDLHVRSDKPWKINPFRCSLQEVEKALQTLEEDEKMASMGANRRLRNVKKAPKASEVLRK
ncbi:MAG TPA: TniB family NTP-binding protein [Candidatus Methanoperedens sp.]